jgi:hypothetical protein
LVELPYCVKDAKNESRSFPPPAASVELMYSSVEPEIPEPFKANFPTPGFPPDVDALNV